MARKTKTIKFMLEFEKPSNADVIGWVACPECKAKPGERCTTRRWKRHGIGMEGGNKMSNLHHDRYALFMNLEIVLRGSLYRIK